MIATAARPEDLGWVEARAGCTLTRKARGVKVVDASGVTRGVVAYDGWTHSAAQMHMAVDTPIAWRELIFAAFDYPFRQLGLRTLVGVIAADNLKSLKMARHAGLEERMRILDGWAPGVDSVVLEIRREDCRYV